MQPALSPEEIALRLGVAALCGLLIGLDREIKHKSVGLRTFLLVCLGAAGFSIAVIEITHYYITAYPEFTTDPTRIVQGVVTGIGFLGGGAILTSKGYVAGAATGASIWVAGAIGVACGYGLNWLAFILSFYTFIVLFVVGYIRVKLRDDMDNDMGEVKNSDGE